MTFSVSVSSILSLFLFLTWLIHAITQKKLWTFQPSCQRVPTFAGFQPLSIENNLLGGTISLIFWPWFCTQKFHTFSHCFIHHIAIWLPLHLTSLFTALANECISSDNNIYAKSSNLIGTNSNFLIGTNRLFHTQKFTGTAWLLDIVAKTIAQ